MNTTLELQVIANEINSSEQFLRDLAAVELMLVGGGDVAIVGN
jgi:hypothetical protein